MEEFFRPMMEASALGIEVLAVAIIVIAVMYGTVRFVLQMNDHDAYRIYKTHLVKALLLGLEFLVAADIIRTVALEATLSDVAVLAALVGVRTFLSWSLVVEMDGRWPWQAADARVESAGSGTVREVA